MGQFGEALRGERLARGISLETISEKTKVVTRYLHALEDEQLELLPGGILSKGIVRAYARTLGLDDAAWVERFVSLSRERGLAPGEQAWVEFVENVGRSRPRIGSRRQMRLRWAGMAVLLVMLCGLGFFVWRHVSGRVMAQEQPRHPVTSAAMAPPGP